MFLKMNWTNYLHNIRKRELDILDDYFGEKKFNCGLEIGAGDGCQTKMLSRRCKAFVSSDLNFDRIKKENKEIGIEYIKLDADKMNGYFSDSNFDLVFSSSVLEHLSSVDDFLSESHRIISNDGISVHIVPNRFMKFFYLFFFYPHLFTLIFDRFFGIFRGKKIFRGSNIQLENNINSVSQKKIGRLKKILLPQIHGNYFSHLDEWHNWGSKQWRKIFIDAGFYVEREIRGPVFSGFGFGFNFFRIIFEKIGFSSERIYILRKKKMFNFSKKSPDELRIAIVTALSGGGYLTDTLLDGFRQLKKEGKNIVLAIPDDYPVQIFDDFVERLKKQDFISFSNSADIIFVAVVDGGLTNYDLVEQIGKYKKMIVIDGSETKGLSRNDFDVQRKIIDFNYDKFGAIEKDLLSKCALYFRREKPYIKNIKPLPYGIESRYIKYEKQIKKDIDFVCIFGQEDFSPMRKHGREMLEDFCAKNNFVCVTKKTKGFAFDDKKNAGREDFYHLLSRAKVGISISGGGYDTARFWETLANNCLLLTERIDIFNPDDKSLDYKRIWQFNNLFDFQYQLEEISKYLKEGYKVEDLESEYRDILNTHSSKARVEKILEEAKKCGLL